jgi:DNA primase
MVQILELLARHKIEARKAAGTHGGEFSSPCPGCGGNDRFRVWPEQNEGRGSWWCRGCGKGGDAIQFLVEFEKMGFQDACRELEVELPERKFKRPAAPPQPAKPAFAPEPSGILPPAAWLEKAEALVAWAHAQLLENSSQLAWLAARGIGEASVKKFRLGWNPGQSGKDLFRPRESWGLPPEYRADGKRKTLWLPIGLVIPMLDRRLRPVRIRIRRPDGEPRYYVISGSCMDCMLIDPIARALVVVESELDGILVAQEAAGVAGAVALGNSSRKPDRDAFEALQGAPVVLNALDYDAAGAKASAWWRDTFSRMVRWPVPKGKDPSEAHQAGANLRAWVVAGLPPAWRIGPSLMVGNLVGEAPKDAPRPPEAARGGEAAESPVRGVREPGEDSDASDPVDELGRLLRSSPVALEKYPGGKGMRIIQDPKWAQRNWEKAQRLSMLAFLDPLCRDYLGRHPESVINGKNWGGD